MKYFKFMEKKYLQRFLQGRSIRIGTLHDYRKNKVYGEEVGDAKEGVREIFSEEPAIFSDVPESIPPIVNSFFPGFENVKRGVIFNCKFSNQENSDDVYIFSLSNQFEVSTMLGLGYDACVEIVDLDNFINCISRKMYKKGLITGRIHSDTCKYGDRRTDSREQDKTPPWSLKEEKHEYQREYRVAWEPARPNLEPLNISCTAIRKYVKLKYVHVG